MHLTMCVVMVLVLHILPAGWWLAEREVKAVMIGRWLFAVPHLQWQWGLTFCTKVCFSNELLKESGSGKRRGAILHKDMLPSPSSASSLALASVAMPSRNLSLRYLSSWVS